MRHGRHGMTLAVKEALNPNTTNHPYPMQIKQLNPSAITINHFISTKDLHWRHVHTNAGLLGKGLRYMSCGLTSRAYNAKRHAFYRTGWNKIHHVIGLTRIKYDYTSLHSTYHAVCSVCVMQYYDMAILLSHNNIIA